MLGALIGDIVGSRYEFSNIRTKDFPFVSRGCSPTDDSILTLALAEAILMCGGHYGDLGANAVKCMQTWARRYPYPAGGYGGSFSRWIYSSDPKPYNSFGNGAAMRVSACAYAAKSLEEAKLLSRAVTEVTHNHPEGIKGAEATTVAIYMALHGSSMQEIRDRITAEYYPIDFTVDSIRDTYRFNEICQGTVPQALEACFEAVDFEDAVRNAISIGGDSDTIGAITGAVAEAYFGIPQEMRDLMLSFLDEDQLETLQQFEDTFGMVPQKTVLPSETIVIPGRG